MKQEAPKINRKANQSIHNNHNKNKEIYERQYGEKEIIRHHELNVMTISF